MIIILDRIIICLVTSSFFVLLLDLSYLLNFCPYYSHNIKLYSSYFQNMIALILVIFLFLFFLSFIKIVNNISSLYSYFIIGIIIYILITSIRKLIFNDILFLEGEICLFSIIIFTSYLYFYSIFYKNCVKYKRK